VGDSKQLPQLTRQMILQNVLQKAPPKQVLRTNKLHGWGTLKESTEISKL